MTQLGADLLDDWLCQVPNVRPFYQERELAMRCFQFMEHRLNINRVIRWLKAYLDVIKMTLMFF